ncbi:MAG: VWA domain-containing protein [Phycisphaerales bacterium]
MNLVLDQPWWMLIAAVGLVASGAGWAALSSVPVYRKTIIVCTRLLAFVCLALALAGLQLVTKSDRVTTIAVVDVSGSIQGFADFGVDDNGQPVRIQDASISYLSQSMQSAEQDDRVGVLSFDARASVIAPPRIAAPGSISRDRLSFDTPEVQGTDIAGALGRAQSLIGPDSRGRIVLISDGVSNASSLDSFSPLYPVDVVPIEYEVSREVIVESVQVPARIAPGSVMPVRVTLRSTGPANGSLRVVVDGQTVDLNPDSPDGALKLALGGGLEPVSISVPVGQGRVHRVRAIWEPELDTQQNPVSDTNTLNNESTALTLSSDFGRVLIVSSDADTEARELIETLEEGTWTVDILAPGEVPTSVLGLEPYDLVVMVNTPRDSLMPGIELAIDQYVRTLGGGLVFVGGYEALGAGGWTGGSPRGWNSPLAGLGNSGAGAAQSTSQESLIENLLPVNLEISDDVVTTHAAVMLVLDSSGSMRRPVMDSSRSQQAVANSSAASAIEVLDATDMVGVVSFSSSAKLVVPIGVNDDPGFTQRRINTIASGGGTNLVPALELARDELLSVDSLTKHIVVLSDGESEGADQLPALAQELGASGIKVSTITIGDLADEQAMRLVATNSGGVYYRVINPAVLPRIFLKAVRVLRRPMVREGRITPVVVDRTTPMLINPDDSSIPAIMGLVLTEHKSDDPRVMVPIVSEKGEPILAGHQVELGRVAVFTSDVSRWTSEWVGTSSFVQFWSNLAQWAGRSNEEGVGELSALPSTQGAGGLSLSYVAIDEQGVPIDGLNVQTKVFSEGSRSQTVDLVQIGPGQYSAELPGTPSGDHVVVATPKLGGQSLRPTIGAVHLDVHTEFDTLRSDRQSLEDLAARSNGRVLTLSGAPDLFTREGLPEVSSYESMWRQLVVLGFILFLIDLGARRVAWDRWISQARDETLAVTRAVRADAISAIPKRVQTQPRVDIDLGKSRTGRRAASPSATPSSSPSTVQRVQQADEDELEELTGLMAAKKRARDRFDQESESDHTS